VPVRGGQGKEAGFLAFRLQRKLEPKMIRELRVSPVWFKFVQGGYQDMKNAKKYLALFLAASMCLGMLASCKPAESEATPTPDASAATTPDAPKVETPIVAAASGFEGKFSPFFASNADDVDVTDLTQMYLMGVDRVSNPVLQGIKGETRAYNGTDYFYDGIADVVMTQNDDGTVYYDLTMRDDIVFSDGQPATIDDVIFSTYVFLDPTYDGSTTLYSCPIEGVDAYRSGMDSLQNVILAAGPDGYTANDTYTEDQYTQFWAAFNAGGVKFSQSIVDYVYATYATDYDLPDPATGAEAFDANAAMWGYGGCTNADEMWAAMIENYGYDMTAINAEIATTSIQDFVAAELGDAAASFQAGVQTGDSAPNVSGIQKTGDYSLRIVATQVDATMIYQMGLLCAPLHYYGDPAQYDYENNKFGFTKGDLSGIKSKTGKPVGAGPFLLNDYSNGTVYMEANPLYYKGEPKLKYLNFLETKEADQVSGLTTNTLDIANPSFSDTVKKEIMSANSNGELTGETITTELIDYRGYGYVGCNPNLVKVGDDPYSDASKALRKAIMTVIAAYRDEGIDSYYGETASVINYPISNTSWAAPQVTDDGYRVAYSLNAAGEDIYTDGMSADDKYAAALEAALSFFEAAGFTVADGKVTAAPEGAKLNYQVEIGGNGQGDHPTFLILKNAGDALAKIGITLNVKDWAQAADLYNTYQTGVAEFWCAAWQSSSDPDMFQLYHSEGSTNYYHIKDAELDELIMEGRASVDQPYRKSIYQAAMEIIMDYAVELPVYQRSECTLFSTQHINLDTLQKDMTPYWTWKSGLDTLEALA